MVAAWALAPVGAITVADAQLAKLPKGPPMSCLGGLLMPLGIIDMPLRVDEDPAQRTGHIDRRKQQQN